MRNQFDIRTEKLMAQEQARAEGLAAGRAEGEAKGKAEGKAEGKEEMAKAMKADGVPVEAIVKYSGLSEAEIKAL